MILDKFQLTGKVAIVTGCRTGLGQGISNAFAEAGADIVGVGSADNANETKDLVEAAGRRFLYIQANLQATSPIERIIKRALDKFGKIDILVNNAGIIRRVDAIEYSEKDWDDVININLKTVFFFSQMVAKQFVKQSSGGKIINIASMLSYQGGIRVPSYTASKAGVMGITRALANEWAKYNININAIAPGYMATDNTADLRANEDRSSEILGRIPAGRWGTAEDLQGAAVMLASEAANYMHGFTLAVDGGWLAR